MIIFVLVLGLMGIHKGYSQTCTMPSDDQWNKVDMVSSHSGNLDYPVSMDVLPDGRVFVIEMWSGDVKLYTPGQGIRTLGSIDVYTDHGNPGVENGGLGLVAHYDFQKNPWIYVFYSRQLSDSNYSAGDGNISPHEHVLTRYTLSNNQLTNPKDIIAVPRLSARQAAGGMDIDPVTGDLYLPTGDDRYPSHADARYGPRQEEAEYLNALASAANTNDLRGKTLRIRPIPFPNSETPEPGIGRTYEIPEGNLREKHEDFWTRAGEDLEKVRPEIYSMGHRNPYRVKVDPITGLSITGDVGPDGRSESSLGPRGREEFNILTADFFGWPYAIGDAPYTSGDGEAVDSGITFDLNNNIANKSGLNTGVTQLPPAIPAFGFYGNGTDGLSGPNREFGTGGQTAIAGPMYHYDENLDSDVKLPAFFNGKWITGDWAMGRLWALEMNGNLELQDVQTISESGYPKIIDMELGPEGTLYILIYATQESAFTPAPNTGALIRLEYTGPQYTADVCSHYLPEPRSTPVAFRPQTRLSPSSHALVQLNPNGLYKVQEGAKGVRIYDLDGSLIRALDFEDGQTHFDIPAQNGMVLFSFY